MLYVTLTALVAAVSALGVWLWRINECRLADTKASCEAQLGAIKATHEARLAEAKASCEARLSELKELYEKRIVETFLSGQNDIRGKIPTFVFRVEELDKKYLGLLKIKIEKSLAIVMEGDRVIAGAGDWHRFTTTQLTPEMKKLLGAIVAGVSGGVGGVPALPLLF